MCVCSRALSGCRGPVDAMVAYCYHPPMSRPIKLSDSLVLDAKSAGDLQQRLIAEQVEFWARLGRCVDELLNGRARTMLEESARQKPLSELLANVGTAEGRERLKAYLASRPYPHFEPHPNREGLFICIEQDGTRSTGRFVNRKFIRDEGVGGNSAVELTPEEAAVAEFLCQIGFLKDELLFGEEQGPSAKEPMKKLA